MKAGNKNKQADESTDLIVDEILDNPHQFTEAAFKFWFDSEGHIRSPFPIYMREELEKHSVIRFVQWMEKMPAEAKKDVNDEIIAEKFEEILFETGLHLAKTEDEKISIRYPFLPRIGDVTNVKETDEESAESLLIARSIEKEGDHSFLKVTFKTTSTGETWETQFELPE